MEKIRRFLVEETATAEATSTVIMIAFVGLLMAAGLALYYGAIQNFFGDIATVIDTWATGWGQGV